MPIFTLEELDQFNYSQLQTLAKYFDVDEDLSRRMLIEQIYKKIELLDEKKDDSPKESVRVRRIRESLKEN